MYNFLKFSGVACPPNPLELFKCYRVYFSHNFLKGGLKVSVGDGGLKQYRGASAPVSHHLPTLLASTIRFKE